MKEQALLALQGPRAAEVLESAIPGVADLGFMEGASFRAFGHPLWISRSGYTGEDGFEISVPAIAAQQLADWLIADERVKPIGLGARDSLRLEAGLPLYGHDLDDRTTPVMAGLNFAINKRRRADRGFAGADRILAELGDGPPVLRVGFEIDGRQRLPRAHHPFDLSAVAAERRRLAFHRTASSGDPSRPASTGPVPPFVERGTIARFDSFVGPFWEKFSRS